MNGFSHKTSEGTLRWNLPQVQSAVVINSKMVGVENFDKSGCEREAVFATKTQQKSAFLGGGKKRGRPPKKNSLRNGCFFT